MLVFSDESVDWPIKVVGAISITDEDYIELESKIHKLRVEYRDFDEIKWNNQPKSRNDFYYEVIGLFFKLESARFHSTSFSIQQNQRKVQYKLCQTISWKMFDAKVFSPLFIYLDKCGKKGSAEVNLMRKYFERSYLYPVSRNYPKLHHKVMRCEETASHVTSAMQIADLFSGCAAYELNLGKSRKCQKRLFRDEFIFNLKKLDNGYDLTAPSPNAYAKWNYFERKFQHYNLHTKSSVIAG